jgi:predicted nucleic acid-binding protein
VASDRVALDTGALMLHFAGDRQIGDTMAKIQGGTIESHTCELNIAELYYKTCETLGSDVAEIRVTSIRESNIKVHPAEESLTGRAGSLKCNYRGRISLADAYILGTSIEYKCKLITTDPILKELALVPTSLLSLP